MKTNPLTVEAISTALTIWERMEGVVRYLHPEVSDDEVYELTKNAMNLALEQARENRGAPQ